MITSVTITDPGSVFAGREVRINYGPFSLREAGLALGMEHPVPVIILATARPEDLETVVEAKHLLITDGPAWHCEECGQVNPDPKKGGKEFTPENALTYCCSAFRCDGTGVREFAVGGPEKLDVEDDAALQALPRVVSCCDAHADWEAMALNSNWRTVGPVWERDARPDHDEW